MFENSFFLKCDGWGLCLFHSWLLALPHPPLLQVHLLYNDLLPLSVPESGAAMQGSGWEKDVTQPYGDMRGPLPRPSWLGLSPFLPSEPPLGSDRHWS